MLVGTGMEGDDDERAMLERMERMNDTLMAAQEALLDKHVHEEAALKRRLSLMNKALKEEEVLFSQ